MRSRDQGPPAKNCRGEHQLDQPSPGVGPHHQQSQGQSRRGEQRNKISNRGRSPAVPLDRGQQRDDGQHSSDQQGTFPVAAAPPQQRNRRQSDQAQRRGPRHSPGNVEEHAADDRQCQRGIAGNEIREPAVDTEGVSHRQPPDDEGHGRGRRNGKRPDDPRFPAPRPPPPGKGDGKGDEGHPGLDRRGRQRQDRRRHTTTTCPGNQDQHSGDDRRPDDTGPHLGRKGGDREGHAHQKRQENHRPIGGRTHPAEPPHDQGHQQCTDQRELHENAGPPGEEIPRRRHHRQKRRVEKVFVRHHRNADSTAAFEIVGQVEIMIDDHTLQQGQMVRFVSPQRGCQMRGHQGQRHQQSGNRPKNDPPANPRNSRRNPRRQ